MYLLEMPKVGLDNRVVLSNYSLVLLDVLFNLWLMTVI